jgi:release factor H-coupled RctB family protein
VTDTILIRAPALSVHALSVGETSLSQQRSTSATVSVFASAGSWIESDAVAQCHQVAALDGMIHVAGMPDLHPGKGAPIGAAMLSSVLYPLLVGSDIGCGIAREARCPVPRPG